MSITQATLSTVFVGGRSAKTRRMPWFASGCQPLFVAESGFPPLTATGATPHTKTAWTQYIASTASAANLLLYSPAGNVYATDSSVLVDIGIGPAGSETVIVPNLPVGSWAFSNIPPITIPVRIPAGSRVAVRAQTGSASRNIYNYISVWASGDHELTPSSVDVIGGDTATSRGVAMSGASGSWTQITASTAQPYQAFLVVPSNGQTAGINANFRLTLGVGAAGSETPIGSVLFNQSSGGNLGPTSQIAYAYVVIGRPLPAGQRLSIQHNIASNPDRLQACVIGVPFR